MAEQWKTIIISNDDKISFFTPNGCLLEYKADKYISEYMPDKQFDKKYLCYSIIIMQLLKEGWEPISYQEAGPGTNFHKIWYFRKKVDS